MGFWTGSATVGEFRNTVDVEKSRGWICGETAGRKEVRRSGENVRGFMVIGCKLQRLRRCVQSSDVRGNNCPATFGVFWQRSRVKRCREKKPVETVLWLRSVVCFRPWQKRKRRINKFQFRVIIWYCSCSYLLLHFPSRVYYTVCEKF